MYKEWSGSRANLKKKLENVLGATGKIIVFGDSLSRQFYRVLDCTLVHKLGLNHRVVYVPWMYGGKLEYSISTFDVIVLNFGHWLQHDHRSVKDQHKALKGGWKDAFKSLQDQNINSQRVFVRTSQPRFVHANSPGEWNTTNKPLFCGSKAPNITASWFDFTSNHQFVHPDENLALLDILKSTQFQLFDIAPITLSRSDTTFDCSHNCMPGVQDTWASIFS